MICRIQTFDARRCLSTPGTSRRARLQQRYRDWREPDDHGRKTVVLTHLTAKPDDDYASWVNDVKKHFSGQVLIAKDLMEF